MNRFSIVAAFAAYGDWWNRDGLTNRDRHRGAERSSISQQLSNIGYSPGHGDYIEEDDVEAQEIYLALVRKWEGEASAQGEERSPPWIRETL